MKRIARREKTIERFAALSWQRQKLKGILPPDYRPLTGVYRVRFELDDAILRIPRIRHYSMRGNTQFFHLVQKGLIVDPQKGSGTFSVP